MEMIARVIVVPILIKTRIVKVHITLKMDTLQDQLVVLVQGLYPFFLLKFHLNLFFKIIIRFTLGVLAIHVAIRVVDHALEAIHVEGNHNYFLKYEYYYNVI